MRARVPFFLLLHHLCEAQVMQQQETFFCAAKPHKLIHPEGGEYGSLTLSQRFDRSTCTYPTFTAKTWRCPWLTFWGSVTLITVLLGSSLNEAKNT